MMGPDEKRIRELEAKVAILEQENALLAESAEDMLLLGLVSESIHKLGDIDALLGVACEKISILKDIPYIACCRIEERGLKIVQSFVAFRETSHAAEQIEASAKVIKALKAGDVLMFEKGMRRSGLRLEIPEKEQELLASAFIPFKSRLIAHGCFLFADNRPRENWPRSMSELLQRLVDIIISRMDNISLIQDLQRANEELGRNLEEGTKELERKTFVLQEHLAEKQKTEKALRKSQEQYEHLMELAQEGIWVIDEKAYTTFVNPSMATMLGYNPDEMIGRHLFSFMDEHGIELAKKNLERRKNGISEQHDFEFLKKDGTPVYTAMATAPIFDEDGSYAGAIAGVLDITTRMRMEEEHRESEAKFRLLAEKSLVGVYLIQDGLFKYVNPKMAEIFGYSVDELTDKMGPKDLTVPADWPTVQENLRKRMDGEVDAIQYDFKCLTKDGRFIDIEVYGSRTIYQDRPAVLGTLLDITDRKRAEEALKLSEMRYRNLIEQSNDAIYLLYDNRFEMINRRFTEMFGYTLEETRSRDFNFINLIAPESRNLIEERIRQLERGEAPEPIYQFTALAKDGRRIECETSVTHIDYKDGKATQGIVRDITERLHTEQEIRKLSQVVMQSPIAVIITDPEGKIEFVNPYFERLAGYRFDEVRGKKPRVLKSGTMPDEVYRDLWHTILKGEVWHGEIQNKGKDGKLFWASITISPIKSEEGKITHFVGLEEDITEQRHLEEQLRQSQKMEAIGQLAGGIAHDFNNLLTVINGSADILLEEMAVSNPFYEDIQQIKKAGERAASLTRQLLAFGRKQLLQPKVLDVNHLIRDMGKLLHRIIGENIQIEMRLAEKLGRVKADPGQIEQVILNLAVNARDAMPGGGRLVIETQKFLVSEQYLKNFTDGRPGPHVRISVSDTGKGIAREIQPRIFEPFYTTKEKGSGLGLATVYGIITQSGGFVQLYSEPGQGTTFNIFLPVLQHEEADAAGSEPAVGNLLGRETILVVEDEDLVRDVTVKVLKNFGYTALSAASGSEALKVFEQHVETCDLVLTDMIMPDMSGLQLGSKIVAMRPEIKMLYMSGYSGEIMGSESMENVGLNFIQKPFEPSQLGRKIREVLDEKN